MRVVELIEILRTTPVTPRSSWPSSRRSRTTHDDITVDRYRVEGMLPWQDDDPEQDNEDGV